MNTHPVTQTWIRIAAFDKPSSAKALYNFLVRHCYTARVQDERNLQRYWFLTKPRAGMYVEVPEESLIAVKNLLQSHPEEDSLLTDAFRCPSCQSLRVQFPQMTRRNIMPALLAHLFVALHFMEPEYYCQDCQYTWDARPRHRIRRSRSSQKVLPTSAVTRSVPRKLSHVHAE
jgi:hypothetical protein